MQSHSHCLFSAQTLWRCPLLFYISEVLCYRHVWRVLTLHCGRFTLESLFGSAAFLGCCASEQPVLFVFICQSCHSCLVVQFPGISSPVPLHVLFFPSFACICPLSPPLHPKINNLCSEARQLFAQKSTQGLGCCSGLGGKPSKFCFHILFFPIAPATNLLTNLSQL